jgi:hypothetical protein
MHLFFALFWLVVSLILFALPWLFPGARPLTIGTTDISLGWFGLLLCAYNLIRWWIARSNAATRQTQRESFLRRTSDSRPKERPYQAPDPNFNFTERPLGPPGGCPEEGQEQRFKP